MRTDNSLAIVDAGPLVAAANRRDAHHARCAAVLLDSGLSLVVPALVVTEVSYFIGERVGPLAEAAFLRGLAGLEVEGPRADDWPRIADLVEQYADFPLGGVDASVVALAERLGTSLIITLDRRHFGAITPKHCPAFRLLPD